MLDGGLYLKIRSNLIGILGIQSTGPSIYTILIFQSNYVKDKSCAVVFWVDVDNVLYLGNEILGLSKMSQLLERD